MAVERTLMFRRLGKEVGVVQVGQTRSNPKDTDVLIRVLRRLAKCSNDPRLEKLAKDTNPSLEDDDLIEALKGYISTHVPL